LVLLNACSWAILKRDAARAAPDPDECKVARLSEYRVCLAGLIVLCYVHSSRRESERRETSIGCRQVWQRPVQHLKIGCISSTALGSVRPAAGEKGSRVLA